MTHQQQFPFPCNGHDKHYIYHIRFICMEIGEEMQILFNQKLGKFPLSKFLVNFRCLKQEFFFFLITGDMFAFLVKGLRHNNVTTNNVSKCLTTYVCIII